MRIAQVAPLYESVPPKYYGGTERVVSYLTEEFVRQGHQMTLFASGDSITKARLVAACPRSLRLDKDSVDQLAHQILMLEHVFQRAAEFDIIHFHVDYLHFPLSRRQPIMHVTTLHGRLGLSDLVPLYQEFPDMPVVSISNAQREPLPWANWQATVYHGTPADLYRLRDAFGLVMSEAMACGTPVIAYRGGAIPEIMEEGHTGFIVRTLKDAVEAVRGVPELRRKRCREVFEKRFTAARMAEDYVQVYKRLIKSGQDKVSGARA